MTRRKVDNNNKLVHKITIRLATPFYKKMKGWLENSNCHSLAELGRAILQKEKINWYQKNASLDAVVFELAAIRKELNAIGRNMNQVTRHFHNAPNANQKIVQALKIIEDYKQAAKKVDTLMGMIDNISNVWLPK